MKNKKVLNIIKVVLYATISVLAQHFYHLVFAGSGGGIAVLVFTVLDVLDRDISIFNFVNENINSKYEK